MGHARGRVKTAYDSECTIKREGAEIYIAVPCMVEEVRDSNQQLEGQTIPVGAFLVCFDVDYTVEQGDYIIEKGRVLEVLLVVSPVSYEVMRRVPCLKVGNVV